MKVYLKIVKEIETIPNHKIIGYTGENKEFPFFMIRAGKGNKKVLISGGVHGDEPAGVFAVIEFFKNHLKDYENNFEFIAFPCVNPFGIENDRRDNFQGLNLNREFSQKSNALETRLILNEIKDMNFLFTMDFHESWSNATRVEGSLEPEGEDPHEFYFWEICADKSRRVGNKILENIAKEGIEICKWEKVYGDINNSGVIWYPEGNGTPAYAIDSVFDSHMAKFYTSQAFTIETARGWDMEKRVKAHLISLMTVLDNYKDK